MKIIIGIIALLLIVPIAICAAINIIGGICLLIGGFISAFFGDR